MYESQSHYVDGRIKAQTVEWTVERPDELRKWHPRSTVLFVVATCGAFWTLVIWALVHLVR